MNRQALVSLCGRRRNQTRGLGLFAVLLTMALAVMPLATLGAAPGGDVGTIDAGTQAFTATLEISPSTVKIGDLMTVTGAGYPADADVDLVYHTVTGRYEIVDRSEFIGQRYDEVTEVLATVRSAADGTISTQITAPAGFGGPHDLRGHVGGTAISQAGLMVQPTVTISPSEGPIGTMVEVRIEGVDLRTKVNTWQLLYDNHYMGFASAVTTDGLAIARFRAAGPVGPHIIQAWNNAYNSTPYLAWDTSPFRNDFDVPVTFTFNVTSDPGYIAPQMDDFAETDVPWPIEETYPGTLSLSVDRGQVGAPTTLTGSDLPANTELFLNYTTMVGNRVSGVGFSEQIVPLGTITTADDGTFTHEMTIPDDLGGSHRIEVATADEVLAATGFVVIPSVLEITPTTVRAGETVEIHLKGLGWTTYDNTYTVSFDNSHVGYVCGFSTNGDVVFKMVITGPPGTHLIDLYPTIYKGEEPTPKTFSVPQLTYAQDHPARDLPAIRLTVVVTE